MTFPIVRERVRAVTGIEYRAFRNTDPPQLAEVWRAQGASRGLMQPMSPGVLERFVLSKPTFDRQGLIVACEGSKIIGFAHAGFGTSADHTTSSTDVGVICLVMTRSEADPDVAAALLARSEAYLRGRGAKTLRGGGHFPVVPFYQGLYGGSELSGILDSDPKWQALFADHGYRVLKRSLVLHCDLAVFRPVVDRQQLQIRRRTTLEQRIDPPTTSWADASLLEPFDRVRFELVPQAGGATGTVTYWNMETMTGTWGVRAVGILGLQVNSGDRRQGVATYLLGESLRQLHAQQGISLAEVHVEEDNPAALALFRRLGFEEVDRSLFYGKD
jgi:ribosomal protein S18 acetylase RimI-like enzyme